jgi:hypothetical protein
MVTPESAFDRETTLIRPVGGAPSTSGNDGSPANMPLEWYDDNLPKTPIIDNTESRADFEDEDIKMATGGNRQPYIPQTSYEQYPLVDLEHGTTRQDQQRQPKDQQQLLNEVYQEKGVVYAPPSKRKKRGDGTLGAACLCCLFLLLSAFAIFLLIAMVSEDVPPFDDSSDKSNSAGTLPPGRPPTQAPLPPFAWNEPTTPLNPYVPGQCVSLSNQMQPHVLSQCECNGAITSLATDVRDRHEALRQQFVSRIYGNWDFPIESCEPANQALVWLSTVTPNDETDLLQRYVLALFYYQNGGTQWQSQDMWLDDTDVCLWYGVACTDRSFVGLLSLDDNNISGSVSRII